MAGRPRLPGQVAEITGASAKNPQMFRDRKTPKVKSLGKPPKAFDEAQAFVEPHLRHINALAGSIPDTSHVGRYIVNDNA